MAVSIDCRDVAAAFVDAEDFVYVSGFVYVLLTHVVLQSILVACYAILHSAMSVGRSVGQFLLSPFTFSAFLSFLSSLLLPKCYNDLLYVHPHATRVAVYPALFSYGLATL